MRSGTRYLIALSLLGACGNLDGLDDLQVGKQLAPLCHHTTMTVTVKTSDRRNAGTNANVYLHLIDRDADGTLRTTTEKKLNVPRRNDFERNATDDFYYEECVSTIDQIGLKRDSAGLADDWHVEYVRVWDPGTNVTYRAIYNQWLPAGRWVDVTSPPQ